MTWIAVEQLHVTRGGVLVQSSTPTAQSGGEARGQHQPRDGEQQDGPLSDVLGQPGEGQHHPVQPVTWHQEITAFLCHLNQTQDILWTISRKYGGHTYLPYKSRHNRTIIHVKIWNWEYNRLFDRLVKISRLIKYLLQLLSVEIFVSVSL